MPYKLNPFTGEFDFYKVTTGADISHHDLQNLTDGDDHLMYFLLAGRPGNPSAIINGDVDANGSLYGGFGFADLNLQGAISNIGGGGSFPTNSVNISPGVSQVSDTWRALAVGPFGDAHVDASAGLSQVRLIQPQGVMVIDDDTFGVQQWTMHAFHYIKNLSGTSNAGNPFLEGITLGGGAVADAGTLHLAKMAGFSDQMIITAVNGGFADIGDYISFSAQKFTGLDTHLDSYTGFSVMAFFEDVDNLVAYDVTQLGASTFANPPISYRSSVTDATMRHIGDAVFGNTTLPKAGLDLFKDVRFFPSAIDPSVPDNNPLQRAVIHEIITAFAPFTLTGFARDDAGPQVSGRWIILYNKSGQTMTLAHESTSSDPDNRFHIQGGVDLVVPDGGMVTMYWSGRWVVVSEWDQTTYTKLAGRPGAANNTLLSIDARGDITGSGAAGFGMGISPRSGDTLDTNDALYFMPDLTTVKLMDGFFRFPKNNNTPITVDTSLNPAGFALWSLAGEWTINDPGQPFVAYGVYSVKPTFKNPSGVALDIGQTFLYSYYNPLFWADDAAVTMGSGEMAAYVSEPAFQTNDSGTVTVSTPLMGFSHEVLGISGAASTVFYDNIGYRHVVPSDAQLAPGDDVAFYVEGTGIVPSGINASLRSEWDLKVLRHAGAGVFGSDADPTNTSVGLELLSTTKAFLPSRLDTTERDALTGVDGMFAYISTLGRHQGYQGGAWETLLTHLDFIDNETPAGTINGLNVTFTLANTPFAGSEHIFKNGLRQKPGGGNDYTISGNTITFAVAPLGGSILLADYRI